MGSAKVTIVCTLDQAIELKAVVQAEMARIQATAKMGQVTPKEKHELLERHLTLESTLRLF